MVAAFPSTSSFRTPWGPTSGPVCAARAPVCRGSCSRSTFWRCSQLCLLSLLAPAFVRSGCALSLQPSALWLLTDAWVTAWVTVTACSGERGVCSCAVSMCSGRVHRNKYFGSRMSEDALILLSHMLGSLDGPRIVRRILSVRLWKVWASIPPWPSLLQRSSCHSMSRPCACNS